MKVVVSPLPPLTDQVRIRERVQSDLPALQKVLVAQQPESGYPLRDPLTFPLDVFLHAGDAVKAWTADLAGEPVGHVCRTGPARKSREAHLMAELCAEAYNCDVRDLTWVNSLFVAASARRLGIGRRLMST